MKTLREIMSPLPVTLGPFSTVQEALGLLEDLPIRHLPIVDDGRLVGMLSDRDLRPWRQALLDARHGKGTLAGAAALTAPVEGLMRPEVLFLDADRTALEALDLLLEFRIDCVPVMSGEDLVGVVTTTDLLRYLRDILDIAR